MNLKEKLSIKTKKLKTNLSALYYACKDKRVGILPKIIIVIAISYALSPIDLIPDFIPIIGYLDGLIIIPMLIGLAIKLIPQNIFEEAKIKSVNVPIKLKDNWIVGILFIGIWILVAYMVIKKIVKLCN